MAKSNLIDVACTYEHQTAAAYLVTPDGRTKGIWVSKQYSDLDADNLSRGEDCVITCELWFAEKIGLV